MYLQYYALAFLLFGLTDKKNWYTWVLLSTLCAILKCNAVLFDVTLDQRYYIRCAAILICALLLMKEYTIVAGYQAFILFLFLAVNPLMLYHTSNENYFYANYEAIIYGLVACQFLAIVPRIWSCIGDFYTGHFLGNKNKQLVDRV